MAANTFLQLPRLPHVYRHFVVEKDVHSPDRAAFSGQVKLRFKIVEVGEVCQEGPVRLAHSSITIPLQTML